MDFPESLKNRRKELRYTQAELANKLHIDPSTISLYESGRTAPDFNRLVELADILECSIDYLFGREQKKEQKPDEPFMKECQGLTRDEIIRVAINVERRQLLLQQQ